MKIKNCLTTAALLCGFLASNVASAAVGDTVIMDDWDAVKGGHWVSWSNNGIPNSYNFTHTASNADGPSSTYAGTVGPLVFNITSASETLYSLDLGYLGGANRTSGAVVDVYYIDDTGAEIVANLTVNMYDPNMYVKHASLGTFRSPQRVEISNLTPDSLYVMIDSLSFTEGEPAPIGAPPVAACTGTPLALIPNIPSDYLVQNVVEDFYFPSTAGTMISNDVIGDVNGDGDPDRAVLIGNKLHIEFMSADGTHSSGPEITVSNDSTVVKRASDFDGDGIPDVVIGANTEFGIASASGAIYFIALNADGSQKFSQRVASSTDGGLNAPLHQGARFGYDIAPYADTDNDGNFNLFAVTAPSFDDGGAINGDGFFIVDVDQTGFVNEQWVQATYVDNLGSPGIGAARGPIYTIEVLGDLDSNSVPDLIAAGQRGITGNYYANVVKMTQNTDGSFSTEIVNNGFSSDFIEMFPNGSISVSGVQGDVVVLGDIDNDSRIEIGVPASLGYPYGINDQTGGSIHIYDVGNNGVIWTGPTGATLQMIAHGHNGFPEILDSNSQMSYSLGIFYDLAVDQLVLSASGNGSVYTIFLTPPTP